MRELKPEETELVGMWLDLGSKVIPDWVYDRIEWLVAERLEFLAEKPDEFLKLYRDPRDGRLWEYERPFEDGPPRLRNVTEEGKNSRWNS